MNDGVTNEQFIQSNEWQLDFNQITTLFPDYDPELFPITLNEIRWFQYQVQAPIETEEEKQESQQAIHEQVQLGILKVEGNKIVLNQDRYVDPKSINKYLNSNSNKVKYIQTNPSQTVSFKNLQPPKPKNIIVEPKGTKFQLDDQEQCPCGSGDFFKNCCGKR